MIIKSHKLTEEELFELYNIGKLLCSDDPESNDLGVGLLKEYPKNIKVKISGLCEYSEGWNQAYSFTLEKILDRYENVRVHGYRTYLKNLNPVIDFVCNLLLDQHYYYEE